MKSTSIITWPLFGLVAMMLGLFAPCVAFGQAVYTQDHQALELGGGRSSSANYTVDAVIGGLGGVVSELAPDGVTRHGYVGQLYEPVGFALAASPLTIDEEGTRQIHAATLNDDDTRTLLQGAAVTWSVVEGPIVEVNAEGLATAAAVYEDTPATVRGQWDGEDESLTLTVLDTLPDNYGMYAADGIYDDWQITWYGLENPNAAPGYNPFGTGDNLFKFYAGLNPTDPNARFNLRILPVAGRSDRKDVQFGPMAAGRVYTVHAETDLVGGPWVELENASAPVIDGDEATVTDLEASEAVKLYQVRIAWPR